MMLISLKIEPMMYVQCKCQAAMYIQWGMQEWYLGWEKVSCLERCPQFERFHCIHIRSLVSRSPGVYTWAGIIMVPSVQGVLIEVFQYPPHTHYVHTHRTRRMTTV